MAEGNEWVRGDYSPTYQGMYDDKLRGRGPMRQNYPRMISALE